MALVSRDSTVRVKLNVYGCAFVSSIRAEFIFMDFVERGALLFWVCSIMRDVLIFEFSNFRDVDPATDVASPEKKTPCSLGFFGWHNVTMCVACVPLIVGPTALTIFQSRFSRVLRGDIFFQSDRLRSFGRHLLVEF